MAKKKGTSKPSCVLVSENDIDEILKKGKIEMILDEAGINIEVLKESTRWEHLVSDVLEEIKSKNSVDLKETVIKSACKNGVLPKSSDECTN